MDYKINIFEKHVDKRGELIVFLKNGELNKKNKKFGQIYFITFNKKGIIRGNHFHKKWREWFGIVNGKVKVELIDIKSNKKKTLILDASKNKYIRLEIGPYIIHKFTSLSKKATLLNYTNTEWSKNDTFLPNKKLKKYE